MRHFSSTVDQATLEAFFEASAIRVYSGDSTGPTLVMQLSREPIRTYVIGTQFYFSSGAKAMSDENFDELMKMFDQLAADIKYAISVARDAKMVIVIKGMWLSVLGDMEKAADNLADHPLKLVAYRTQQLFLK